MKQTMMPIQFEIPVNIFADIEAVANSNFRSINDHIIHLICREIEEYHDGMLEENPEAIGFKVGEDEDKSDNGDLVLKKHGACKCRAK